MTGPANDTGRALRRLLREGALDLPLPAAGDTPTRLARLCDLTRSATVSVGRLAEAHTDAVAILAEAGRVPAPGDLYGVWASNGKHGPVVLDRRTSSLTGTKPFCSGLGIVDRALVTVDDGDGRTFLADVDVRPSASLRWSTRSWQTPALADTATGVLDLVDHPIDAAGLVGPPGWYLERPGFWHGACGPAACWAGGALGLVDDASTLGAGHDPAALGELRAAAWGLAAVLHRAGTEIDEHPGQVGLARSRALMVRHLVERSCSLILDRFGWMAGPRALAGDGRIAQRFADVQLYVRQHGGTRDLAELGSAGSTATAPPPPPPPG